MKSASELIFKYEHLQDLARQYYFCCLISPDPVTILHLNTMTKGRNNKTPSVKESFSHCNKLVRDGFIKQQNEKYVVVKPLPLEFIRVVITEGNEKNWLDTFNLMESKGRNFSTGLRQQRLQLVTQEPSKELITYLSVMYVFLGSSASAPNFYKSEIEWKFYSDIILLVVDTVFLRSKEIPTFTLVEDDPLLLFVAPLLSCTLFYGKSSLPILESLKPIMSATIYDRYRSLYRNYCAACLLVNRRDLLEVIAEDQCDNFYLICDVFFTKGISAATKLLRQNLRYGIFLDEEELLGVDEIDNGEYSFYLSVVRNVPVRFLLGLMYAFEKGPNIGKSTPIKWFELSSRYCSCFINDKPNAFSIKIVNSSQKITFWREIVNGNSYTLCNLIKEFEGGDKFITLFLVGVGYHTVLDKQSIQKYSKEFKQYWNAAENYYNTGWVTLSRLLSSLVAGLPTPNDWTPEKVNAIRTTGIEFLPYVEPEPYWKSVTTALEKVLDKKSTVVTDDTTNKYRFVWIADIDYNDDGIVYRIGIKPMFLYDTDDKSTYPEVIAITCAEQIEGKNKNLFTSEERELVLSYLVKTNIDYRYDNDRSSLLLRLCGAKNLYECKLDYHYNGTYEALERPKQIELKYETCSFTSQLGIDGSVKLTISEWALSILPNTFCMVCLDSNQYAFRHLTKEQIKFLTAVKKICPDGQLTIPREGMQVAENLVNRLSNKIPMEEVKVADGVDLPHFNGASNIRMRLDYTENTLKIRAVVLPLPEKPDLVLQPGVGPTEKVIMSATGNLVLRRDLNAEKAAFENVHQTLAPFDSAFDGISQWTFEDMAQALEALVVIKGLGSTAPLEWMSDNKVKIAYAPKSGVHMQSTRTAEDWFRVEGSFELDDGRIVSVIDMLEANRNRIGNYVKLSNGDFVKLTESISNELDALSVASRRKGNGVEIVKAAIPMLEKTFEKNSAEGIELPDALAITAKEIHEAFTKRPKIPDDLHAELRPYQNDGFRWLARLAACGFGACLADDMGLGKTVQIIALLLLRANDGASLVIAPSSVCGNWRRELERFAPTLKPVMAMEEDVNIQDAQAGNVVITSYGYLLFHAETFQSKDWNGLVLDEAQAIKNDASKRAQYVKKIPARFRVAATGTPIENRLGELWSLFDFLNPGLLGTSASFVPRFTIGGKATPQLKRLVKPLILRRLKGDVLNDLPEKTEVTIPVEMGRAERSAYEGCRQHALALLASKSEEAGGEANRISILAELTRLRRFCCHPSLVLPDVTIPSAKMEALIELLEGLHDGHHRALVFSQFTDYLAIVRKMLEAHGWSYLYLDGSTPTLERERLVNRFQAGEGEFFVISLKAGGTGLNLTAANYVILLDPWWNPAVENQAADRAHRIGQRNPVTVYRLINTETVEARVIELHKEKQAIAEDVLDGTGSTALTPEQLMRLFT